MRYVVPYSAPGIKWGQLRIEADSSAEASTRAQEIHGKGRYKVAPGFRTGGPGAGFGSGRAWTPRGLVKRERSQITYGEPLALVDAVAS